MLEIIIILLVANAVPLFYVNYKLGEIRTKLSDAEAKLDKLSDKLDNLINILTENKIIEAKPNGAAPPLEKREQRE